MRISLLQFVALLFVTINSYAKHISIGTTNLIPGIITTQPKSQLECEGNSVKFKVDAIGVGLTYTWQCCRPSDTDFVTITDVTNNSEGSSTNEIKILNVGSAKYPDGTRFKVLVSDGVMITTSTEAILTVNSIISVLPTDTDVVKCYGANYSYTVSTSYPANVVSYQWKKSVVSGIWDEISDGGAYSGVTTATLTITGGTPAQSAGYRVYITFHSSGADCNTTSATRTRKLTFLPELTIPVTTTTQPTCVEKTGTIAVTTQSATDTYSFDNGFSFQASNEKSGLAVGSYNVLIKNKAGCVSSTTTCQIVSESSTWDGVSWLNGTPNDTKEIIFTADYNSTADIEACSCRVTNGAKVVINSVHTLKLINEINVVSGTLTFENNASLVQINNTAINTGAINYKRHTAAVSRYDFTYWSSPVFGQTLKNLSPNTLGDKYYSYDPNSGWVISYNGTATMVAGNGYLIRAPQNFSITNASIDTAPVFIGVPNNGIVNLALTANKSYLLGNPYPSAIDADVFLDVNSAVLEGTLYFWTHNSLPSKANSGDYAYNYTSNDYAVYNRTGGVGMRISTAEEATTGGAEHSGKIASGQGFFAPSSADGGTLVFNNAMRVSGGISGDNNSQFFKMNQSSKQKTTVATDKNRIWLNLTNSQGAFKQMLIGYLAGATNNYEGGFDGVTYDGNQYADFYSVSQGVNLSIQGRALPFKKQDSVVLGYKSTIKGDFKISIDHTDGVLDNQQVYLQDKELQLLHDLIKEPYVFTTETGVFNSRFILRYQDKNKLQEEAVLPVTQVSNNNVLISVQQTEILIHSPVELLDKVTVYDAVGRKIYQQKKIQSKDFMVPNLGLKHQMFVVSVMLGNDKKINKKIMY